MNLKEFSAHLGLSATTVSRALGGYPEVNEDTRRRVADAAKALGYQPNPRARALATGRARVIGHILSSSDSGELVNPIFGDFVAGVVQSSNAEGYDVMLKIAEGGDEERIFRKLKREGAVAGIVVPSPKMNDPRIALLNEIGLAFVVHGRASDVGAPYSWVDVNNQRALERATRFLTDLGHRRIALVNGRLDYDFALRRLNGYRSALAVVGVAPDPNLETSGDMTEANGYENAASMLEMDNPPTGFLAASIMSAIGIRRAVQDKGLDIGRDVSLIAYDDDLSYLSNREADPHFTSIRSSVHEAGREAAEMLMRRIENPDSEPESVLLEAELILGNSTGPCPT